MRRALLLSPTLFATLLLPACTAAPTGQVHATSDAPLKLEPISDLCAGDTVIETVFLETGDWPPDATVTLISANPNVKLEDLYGNPITSLPIDQGVAQFHVRVVSPVPVAGYARIRAEYDGASVMVGFHVAGSGAISSYTLSSAEVVGGHSASGTITFCGGGDPAAKTVTVQSDSPFARVPASVSPNAYGVAHFNIDTVDPHSAGDVRAGIRIEQRIDQRHESIEAPLMISSPSVH